MKKRYVVLIILVVVIGGAILGGNIIISNMEKNLHAMSLLPIPSVDINRIADGTYTGHFEKFPLKVQVEVTVENHRIVSIALIEHSNGQGSAAEVIPGHVVANQSLQVDSIAGATYSSKAILFAIHAALEEGLQ
jgi:major membrane immunogen (membrane-anchored lipoprotein)